MWTGIIQGTVTASTKHATLRKGKMVIVQPLNPVTGKAEGLAQIAIDTLGAGHGQHVLVSSDGLGTQRVLDTDKSCPARLFVGCILHETSIQIQNKPGRAGPLGAQGTQTQGTQNSPGGSA